MLCEKLWQAQSLFKWWSKRLCTNEEWSLYLLRNGSWCEEWSGWGIKGYACMSDGVTTMALNTKEKGNERWILNRMHRNWQSWAPMWFGLRTEHGVVGGSIQSDLLYRNAQRLQCEQSPPSKVQRSERERERNRGRKEEGLINHSQWRRAAWPSLTKYIPRILSRDSFLMMI